MTEFNERLIEKIKSYPYLFQSKHASYKDTQKKRNAWNEISAYLGKPADECSKRWKTLRDRYAKEKRQLQKASGSGASQTKTWKFMPYMEFLHDHISHRSTVGNFPPSNVLDFSADDSAQDVITLNCEIEDMNTEVPNQSMSDKSPDNSRTSPVNDTVESACSSASKSKNTRKKADYQNRLYEIMERNSAMIEKAASAQAMDDDAAYYGKLIASKLRRLPPTAADSVMIKIFKLLSTAESELAEGGEINSGQ